MNRKCNCNNQLPIGSILQSMPQAVAVVNGSDEYPDIYGLVKFYQSHEGVLVYAEITGLPKAKLSCGDKVFGFHVHSGTSCTGNKDDPFSDTMTHYNPDNCAHPYHSGDFPPLFGNNGKALSIFLTNRFSVNDVLGRTVIIHDHFDDLTTQPSGNSGKKIACGVIRSVARQ